MSIEIRDFRPEDGPKLVSILKLNDQFAHPDIEGTEAMGKVARCEATVFLVAETAEGKVAGCIKAVYDGSRALVHLLSIHPEHQRQGIGTALVHTATDELAARGAPTVSVTITDESAAFWTKLGFGRVPVFLMLKTLASTEEVFHKRDGSTGSSGSSRPSVGP